MSESRERFEAWLRADIAPLCDFERHSRKDAQGNYIDSWVLSNWSAWQAAERATIERLNAREPEAKTNMDDNGYISVAFTRNWCGEQGMFWPKATLEELK